MLQVENLSFSYPERPIFQDLTFSAEMGSSTAILGSSGSGKTTLFQLLSGVLSPDKGAIKLEGKEGFEGFQKITYMMQKDLLLPWKNVYENILLLASLGLKKVVKEEVMGYLKQVGLLESAHLYPHQLSTGMRQRVSLARALMLKRPFLFLDEPFSSVDLRQKKDLYALVLEAKNRFGFTLFLITHDFEEAYALCDRVLFLKEGGLRLAPPKNEWLGAL